MDNSDLVFTARDRDGKVLWVDEPDFRWPRPIPVSERLPDSGDVVLLWGHAVPEERRGPNIQARWTQGNLVDIPPDSFFSYSGEPLYDITHWLPLPPKPE